MTRIVLILVAMSPAFCADWNPKLAADYLDSRQKDWFAWKVAAKPGGPCLSCHTGLTYLMARPALRGVLHEEGATEYETGLRNSLLSRIEKKDPPASQSIGVEAIISALALNQEKAFDRLWALQIKDGPAKGAWPWFSLQLDPWEEPESRFFGASLAALAIGNTAASYRQRPDVREHIDALVDYLQRETPAQPLHNQLMLLWASAKLPEALAPDSKRKIIDEAWKKQQPDGGWTIQSLGPWIAHPTAPESAGSNGYATALTAYVLEQSGAPVKDRKMARAIRWLKSHQDAKSGYWEAESMNKHFEPGSMESQFMRDAATGFAVMALTPPVAEARP